MKSIRVFGFLILTSILLTGCGAETPRGHQRELTCPSGWEDFCGGWTVVHTNFANGDAQTHIDQGDRFVIGQRGPQLFLFPRTGLKGRWGGAVRRPLWKVDQNGKCLVGRVKLGHGPQWHIVLVTAGEGSASGSARGNEEGIGREVILNLEMGDQPAKWSSLGDELENWPADLWPPKSCELPHDEEPGKTAMSRDHNGIVHAED